MAFDEHGYICPYNDGCRCQIADCDYCGWNPTVAERRLEAFYENQGIEKSKVTQRPIDAVELAANLEKAVLPLAEGNSTPRKIYSTVMKCIAAAPTIETDTPTCEHCRFAKFFEESGKWKCRSQKGMYRIVSPDFSCSRGERREATEDGK